MAASAPKSGLYEWSIGGYVVRLLRQDELEGGVVLHFVVSKPPAEQKKGLFRLGTKQTQKKPAPKPETQPQQQTEQEGLLIKYSRKDPVAAEAVVGIYLKSLPQKGSSAQEYSQQEKALLYQAANLAAAEAKRLGLDET